MTRDIAKDRELANVLAMSETGRALAHYIDRAEAAEVEVTRLNAHVLDLEAEAMQIAAERDKLETLVTQLRNAETQLIQTASFANKEAERYQQQAESALKALHDLREQQS